MIDKIIRLIKVERVDDIPVLLAQVQKMQVPALLDQFFPTHGHWKGELSFGEVVAVWLTFVARRSLPLARPTLGGGASRYAGGLFGQEHSPAGLQR
jgi:hypothetical protein